MPLLTRFFLVGILVEPKRQTRTFLFIGTILFHLVGNCSITKVLKSMKLHAEATKNSPSPSKNQNHLPLCPDRRTKSKTPRNVSIPPHLLEPFAEPAPILQAHTIFDHDKLIAIQNKHPWELPFERRISPPHILPKKKVGNVNPPSPTFFGKEKMHYLS